MNSKLLLVVPLIGTLSACGDITTESLTGSSADGTVSVLITDNLTLDYSEVWISVRSITATDNSGQTVTLYEDASGQTHNLSQLVNVGALVDTQNIAAGTYVSFDVVLANEITLVDQAGTLINASFDQSGNPSFSQTVTGTLDVAADQTSTLALDFDLKQFTYEAASNTVAPVIVQADPVLFDQTLSTLYGEVKSVTSNSEFIFDPQGDGADLTIKLHNTATVTNTATGEVLSNTSGLSTNTSIRVSGSYDAATLTVTASDIQIENGAVSIRHVVEGTIISVGGGTLSIDVHEASFMPDANTMSMDVSNATFSRGDLTQLSVGQKIEIKGSWDNSNFTPAVVEIEGYSSNSNQGSENYIDDYAEIKGEITAVNNAELTLTVQKAEHVSGIATGDSIIIDSSNSWIKHGDSSCLVVGTMIEAKGGITNALSMDSNSIEIESGCGDNSSNGDSGNDSDSDSGNDSDNESNSDSGNSSDNDSDSDSSNGSDNDSDSDSSNGSDNDSDSDSSNGSDNESDRDSDCDSGDDSDRNGDDDDNDSSCDADSESDDDSDNDLN